MILLIDIGNTNIGLALAKEQELISNYRINTDLNRSYDEYYLAIKNFVADNNIADIVISSVVPRITELFVKLCDKYFYLKPMMIEKGIKTGVNIKTSEPKDVGSDLICDIAGLEDSFSPTLIIDLGTANKYLYVEKNTLIGAVISPGIPVTVKALVENAALLPDIDLTVPKSYLGTDTVSCMQSGIIYGTVFEVEGFIKNISLEIGKKFEIYITGGLSSLISPLLSSNVIRDKLLVFKGMLRIYYKNRVK